MCCWRHVSQSRSIARTRGGTIKLYLTGIYNTFRPCQQIAVLDCWERFNGDKWRQATQLSWSGNVFSLSLLLFWNCWPVTGVILFFFLFFFFSNFKVKKKACIWAFQPGALTGAVRSCAAPLMCFLNYPHWIHYLFALLNLLNLAALQ